MLFGWTAKDCLQMPATRFFSLLKSGQKIYDRRFNYMMRELCDVVVCATGVQDYHEKITTVYHNRLEQSFDKPKADCYDLADSQQGAHLMMKMMGALRGMK